MTAPSGYVIYEEDVRLEVSDEERVILDGAVKVARGYEPGGSFQLTDLVDGEEWEALGKGRRLALGMAFKRLMEAHEEFELIEKDGANHRHYERL